MKHLSRILSLIILIATVLSISGGIGIFDINKNAYGAVYTGRSTDIRASGTVDFRDSDEDATDNSIQNRKTNGGIRFFANNEGETENGEAEGNGYTITWINDDGTTLETDEKVAEGATPSYDGETPTKESNAEYDYTFNGWSPAVTSVTKDAAYTAVYKAVKRRYTVTWISDNTEIHKDENVEYGTEIVYDGPNPVKQDAVFIHWEDQSGQEPGEITGDTTFTAVFADAPIVICMRDKSDRQPIAGAIFELYNSQNIKVWMGTTNSGGVINIPEVSEEATVTTEGGGAKFEDGSSYTLRQLPYPSGSEAEGKYYVAQGSWTVKVKIADGIRTFSMTRAPASDSDLTTQKASGPYGVLFYLYNVGKSFIHYDYNNGSAPSEKTALSDLSYDLAYEITADNPVKNGYEFAGWSLNGSSRTYMKGDTARLDTVNISDHVLKACWRSPLTVNAVIHENGNVSDQEDSEGTFNISEEKTLSFDGIQGIADAYGTQNQVVAALNARNDIGVSYATLKTGNKDITISSLRYNASEHSWQYRLSDGATTWTNTTDGDVLTLHYVSNVMKICRVMEANEEDDEETGSFTLIDSNEVSVGESWTARDILIEEAFRPIVLGKGYFAYYGAGADGVSNKDALEKSGLDGFEVKKTNEGFRLRTDGSEGTLLSGNCIYIVYSKTPPKKTAFVDVENYTGINYSIKNLWLGSESDENDLIRRGRLILVKDDGDLQVIDGNHSVEAGNKERMALLGGGTSQFIIGGSFSEAESGTIMSVGVVNSDKVVRTSLTTADQFKNTKSITKGKLEDDKTVRVTFDTELEDLVIKKEWQDVPDAAKYIVSFKLFETEKSDDQNGIAGGSDEAAALSCTTDEVSGGIYSTNSSKNWEVTAHNLPRRCGYLVEENSIKQGSSDVTEEFSPNIKYSGNAATITNKSSVNVCRVGEEVFPTIKAAVNYIVGLNMTTGAVIEMIDDYVMAESGSVTIPTGYSITLKSDGPDNRTISRGFANTTDAFVVSDGAKLTVESVNVSGRMNSNSWFTKEGNGGLFTVKSGGTLALGEGAVISRGRATGNGSAVYIEGNGSLLIAGASIKDCRSGSGGAIGFESDQPKIYLSGDTVIRDNHNADGYGQYNIYLDQANTEIINITSVGMGAKADVGVYVANGTDNAIYNNHGLPAKPFGTVADGGDKNLNKIINDRISSDLSNYASRCDILADSESQTAKMIWGETFTLMVKVDWLDGELESVTPEDSWTSTLSLAVNGSNSVPVIPHESVKTEIEVGSSNNWTCTFTGLARYDTNGNPYKYYVNEVIGGTPDYRKISFIDEVGTKKTPLKYTEGSSGQIVNVHNKYKYTNFTVVKNMTGFSEGEISKGATVRSTITLYKKYKGVKADGYEELYRKEDLPGKINISYFRQDGDGGAVSVGGESAGRSCVIQTTGNTTEGSEDNKHEFKVTDPENERLDSDYYYYAVETSINETNGIHGRSISETHKIVATYDPRYDYDQNDKKVTITNNHQDYLSVDKKWSDDIVSLEECTFEIYRVGDGNTVTQLKNTKEFEKLVKNNTSNWTKVGEFTLPEKGGEENNKGSWVHVIKKLDDGSAPDLVNNVYFVKETKTGAVSILNPDVNEKNAKTDAVYSYDERVNQITVKNLSEILCKIVDDDPDTPEHAFRKIVDALEYGRTRDTAYGPNDEFTIQMLRDYNIPSNDIMAIKAGEKIALTTAATSGGVFNYSGDGGKTRATITRKSGNAWSFFRVSGDAADVDKTSFTMFNLELDGADTTVNYNPGGGWIPNGGIVNANNAKVILEKDAVEGTVEAGVRIKNAKASNGGAIYAANSIVDIDDSEFENCKTIDTNGSEDKGGSVVWTSGERTNIKDSIFKDCSSKSNGGAIASVSNSSTSETTVENCRFTGCTSSGYGGAVYSRNYKLSVGGDTAAGCIFGDEDEENADPMRCSAGGAGGAVMHRNLNAGTQTDVQNCKFYYCVSTGTGDDIGRDGGGGLATYADRLVLRDSYFLKCRATMRGGGVLQGKANDKTENSTTLVDNCIFDHCESERSGGGGMHLTGINQTITNCTLTYCKALASAGGGIDIGCFNKGEKNATVEHCTIKYCESGSANGGGICFGGNDLTVNDVIFENCTAVSTSGGGISFSAGGIEHKLEVRDCSFKNCNAPKGNAGAIYTQSAELIVKDPNGAKTTFTDCTSWNSGGAIFQNKNTQASKAELDSCSFSRCTSKNGDGGAMLTYATKIDVTDAAFDDCHSKSWGGAIAHSINGGFVTDSHAIFDTIMFSDVDAGFIEGNRNLDARGGAIYTNALTLSIEGNEDNDTKTFQNVKSTGAGGSVYHNREHERSATTLLNCSFENIASTNGGGGAVYTTGTTLDITDSSFNNCSSRGWGGAVHHSMNGNFIFSSHAIVTGTTFADTSAGFEGESTNDDAHAGAFYTNALTLSITGEKGVKTFCNTKAKHDAGAVYHNRANRGDTTTTLTDCSFETCTSANNSAGALMTNALKLGMDNCSFETCNARYSGGAVHHTSHDDFRNEPNSMTDIKDCTFIDTHAGVRGDDSGGGAVYTNATHLSVTGVAKKAVFKNNTAVNKGGAIWHNRNNTVYTTLFIDNCSFGAASAEEGCISSGREGGAVSTYAVQADIKRTSFENCRAKSHGGAVFHSENDTYVKEKNNNTDYEGCRISVTDGSFKNCSSENDSGGAIYSNALAMTVNGESELLRFDNCDSGYIGGALRHESGYLHTATVIEKCSFDDCDTDRGTNGEHGGGGVWTKATTLRVTSTDFNSCDSNSNGGGIFHFIGNDSQVSSSRTDIENCSFNECKAANKYGGAIRSDALKVCITGKDDKATIKGCDAAYRGGAVYQSRSNEGSLLTIDYCSIENCNVTKEWGNKDDNYNDGGGAINVRARTLEMSECDISDCTSFNRGGLLLYGNNERSENKATITDCTFIGGKVSGIAGHGGGLFFTRVDASLNGTMISGCSATGYGGGIYQHWWNSKPLKLDGCTISDNEAGRYGGGIFFDSNNTLTLCNGTSVTGNKLGVDDVANGAGIYMLQDRKEAYIVLGKEGMPEDSDTITVYDNLSASGEQSNLRLINNGVFKTGRFDDKATSVYLMSNLVKKDGKGVIGVCNPGHENTQFGTANINNRTGVDLIQSDIDTLYGIVDPANRGRLIWYAPPICRITNENGNQILYYGEGKIAGFSSLKAAFEVANNLSEGYLYYDNDGQKMTADKIQIQMLVPEYELPEDLPALKRDVTLTTASPPGKGEYDYPVNAPTDIATIIRGPGCSGSMITVASGRSLAVTYIILDGGSTTAGKLKSNEDGGIIKGEINSKINLTLDAVLQNSSAGENRGGAVYVTGGSEGYSFTMDENAKITNCSANEGGAVYLTGDASAELDDTACIENCCASRYGGAMYVSSNASVSFGSNPNPVITGNYISEPSGSGAGFYLPDNDSKLYLELRQRAHISGNYVKGASSSDRTIGGRIYDVLPQDFYIGESKNLATSINLVGQIEQDQKYPIWVLAENEKHYKQDTQFAVIQRGSGGSVSDVSMAVFKNARDDGETENSLDEPLYGVRGTGTQVVWSISSGGPKVILRKVDKDYNPVKGAKFTIYRGSSTDPYVVVLGDKSKKTLEDLESGDSGVFWISRLPKGEYQVEETKPIRRWFTLTVTEGGASASAARQNR